MGNPGLLEHIWISPSNKFDDLETGQKIAMNVPLTCGF